MPTPPLRAHDGLWRTSDCIVEPLVDFPLLIMHLGQVPDEEMAQMERLKAGGDLVLEDHKRGEIDAHFATGARSLVRALSAFRIDTHQ